MKVKVLKDVEAKYLLATFQPRYFEDSKVGDSFDTLVEEDEEHPKMPLIFEAGPDDKFDFISPYEKDKRYIKWLIEVDTGRILNWPQGVFADVFYKVCDQGNYSLLDENKEFIGWVSEDYVPGCLSIEDNGYGDYFSILVNGEGYIQHWNPEKVAREYMDKFNEDRY